MPSFAELLSPITPEVFFSDFYGKKPLYIPADPQRSKRQILDWSSFNAALDQTSIWTPQTLKLVENTQPIEPEAYCRLAKTQNGEQLVPDPAKVQLRLAHGATLVAGDVQNILPRISQLATTLGQTFSASAQANIYCSFKGVRGFASHYDLTDVLAIQTEGKKLWRIYANRADTPVSMPVSPSQARQYFEATKGALVEEVMMQPGDVLYLPRGTYHDALAQDGASLHVTFAIAPLYGRIIFNLLEQAALQDSLFRTYLPPASLNNGRDLQAHLAALGQRLALLAGSAAFRDEVAMTQERIIPRHYSYGLPEQISLTRYQRTGTHVPHFNGPVVYAMEWALSQSSFVLEDMIAQFNFIPEATLRQAVQMAEQAGTFKKV